MDSIPEVLNYIRKKYCKEDLVLSLLIGQFRELKKPKLIHQSITNIEKFLITFGHMVEWGLQQNFNSKARAEVIPMLFFGSTKETQVFSPVLVIENTNASSSSSLLSENAIVNEQDELKSFDAKLARRRG